MVCRDDGVTKIHEQEGHLLVLVSTVFHWRSSLCPHKSQILTMQCNKKNSVQSHSWLGIGFKRQLVAHSCGYREKVEDASTREATLAHVVALTSQICVDLHSPRFRKRPLWGHPLLTLVNTLTGERLFCKIVHCCSLLLVKKNQDSLP